MTNLIFPQTANAQGYAFEDLLHRVLPLMGYEIQMPSGWYHFDKKWYQLDGLVKQDDQLWLLEAKFVQSNLTPKSVNLDRRLELMKKVDANGMLFATISPNLTALIEEHGRLKVPLKMVEWDEIVSSLPKNSSAYRTCTLDPIAFDNAATFSTEQHRIFSGEAFQVLEHPMLKNVMVVPDEVETWVRRMPLLSAYRDAVAPYTYQIERGKLQPVTGVILSIAEAWQIQDDLSGFANRVLSAIEKTLIALSHIDEGDASTVQQALPVGTETGLSGVRSSLANLALWGLVHRETKNRKTIYKLNAVGKGITIGAKVNLTELREVITNWSPYMYFKKFYEAGKYQLDRDEIINWYREQYKPFIPYARSLFNPNKVEGLIHLYRHLENG